MTSPYTDEQLADIAKQYHCVRTDLAKLITEYASMTLAQRHADEHAKQGFARRLATLRRCLQNVFTSLPPERTAIPDDDTRKDAEINIQAFVFNVFGALDNLAWIWVLEKQLARKDGTKIPPSWIGIWPQNKLVRGSLSVEFQEKLDSFKPWFEHIENFRHALAHRIPLYIPPQCIDPKDADDYSRLDREMYQQLLAGNIDRHKELEAEQAKLFHYKPFMLHSVHESPTAVIHPTLIADSMTVVDLAKSMQTELLSLRC